MAKSTPKKTTSKTANKTANKAPKAVKLSKKASEDLLVDVQKTLLEKAKKQGAIIDQQDVIEAVEENGLQDHLDDIYAKLKKARVAITTKDEPDEKDIWETTEDEDEEVTPVVAKAAPSKAQSARSKAAAQVKELDLAGESLAEDDQDSDDERKVVVNAAASALNPAGNCQ